MSVIPLTLEGPNPTVVQRPDDFDNKGRAIFIRGLDAKQLNDPNNSNAGYDLRVGSRYRDHHARDVKEIGDEGMIRVEPARALMIWTEEEVWLPRTMYGLIAPRLSLLQVGLSTTFSKVDPGYAGHLLITLFNLGKATITIRRRDPVCALTLFEVGAGARMYNKGAKQIEGEPPKEPRQTLRDWVRTYPALAGALVAAAASAVLTVVNIVLVILRKG